MKKSLLYIIVSLNILPFIGFAADGYPETIDSKSGGAIQNIYANTCKYYEENMGENSENAVKQLAGEYGANEDDIRDVLAGDSGRCINFIKNMSEIELKGDQVKPENLQQCKDILVHKYHNYNDSEMGIRDTQDTVSSENIFVDGNADNSPYDLLIDMKDITGLLFKEEIEVKLGNIKFNDKDSNGGGGGSPSSNNNSGGGNSGNSGGGNGSNTSNNSNNINNSGGGNTNQSGGNNQQSGTGNNSNTDNGGTNIQSGGNNQQSGSDVIIRNIKTNSKLQIGNICAVNGISSGNNYQAISNLDSGFVDGSYKNNGNGNNGSGGIAGNSNGGGNANQYSNISFDSFLGSHVDGGGLPGGVGSFFGGGGGDSTKQAMSENMKKNGGNGKSCFGKDKILTICVTLVPSGPRGPLGGDVRKKSLEGNIDKNVDTNRDLKESFIVPAGHADESLGINYKHVKFDQIIAFNVVINGKPVFPFKDRDKIEKEENKADTDCDNVPRKFAAVYKDSNIVDCFNKEGDKNKYRITNENVGKMAERVDIKPEERVEQNSSKGLFSEEKSFTDFNMLIKKTFGGMKEVTAQHKKASKTMLDISEN